MAGASRAAPEASAAIQPDRCLHGGGRQIGGRFWILAGSDEDDDDDDLAGESTEDYSPTPSDVICEAFHPGYSEEEVATIVDGVVPLDDPARRGLHSEERVEVVRRIIHRRSTAAAAGRAWSHGKGPFRRYVSNPLL